MSKPVHEGVSINVTLAPAPPSRKGFGGGLILDQKSESSLNGDRVTSYASVDKMKSDETSGYLASNIVEAGRVWFGQGSLVEAQDELVVGNWDDTLNTPETPKDGLDAIIPMRSDFYAVMMDDRTDPNIKEMSDYIDGLSDTRLLGFFQSNAPEWTTKNPGSGLPDLIGGNERSVVQYHDTDSEWQDVAHPANRLIFSPDNQSAPWGCEVAQVAELDRQALQQSQVGNVKDNNANIMLPFGSTDTYIKPGQTMADRKIYVIITKDWFETRLKKDVEIEIQSESQFGRKVPVSQEGQTQLAKLVRKRFKQGERVDHFKTGTTSVSFPKITDSNRNNGVIPLDGSAILEVDGQKVDFNFEFERNA